MRENEDSQPEDQKIRVQGGFTVVSPGYYHRSAA